MKLLLILLLLLSTAPLSFSYAKTRYKYDYSDPESIVRAACVMLLKADYEEMTNITELVEKKRTLSTLDSMKEDKNLKILLKKESEKLISYEIVGKEDFTNNLTNQLFVVTVKWTLKIDNDLPKNPSEFDRVTKDIDTQSGKKKKNESIVYTDYLLMKFDDKWKIVSKKSH